MVPPWASRIQFESEKLQGSINDDWAGGMLVQVSIPSFVGQSVARHRKLL